MFSSRICRINFTQGQFFFFFFNLFNRLQIPAQVQHERGERKGEWGERGWKKKSRGTSLPLSCSLSPAALPSLFRILYRAIRPRRGPDKQEPLDWKQLWGIRKVCVPGLGSGTWACVCQCMYACACVHLGLCVFWSTLISCAAARISMHMQPSTTAD